MHIKRVVISGFKTYRTETIIDDFSAECNLVLGKNGSGKSNLLDAVQFVLTDKYASLSGEERAKLLHEGAGHAVVQADVEVVFDNSDKRIPIESKQKDSTEVTVRRTIGLKKDQYLVNGNPYSLQDFQNLMESAGLSNSNAYYIVEQGKISHLMKQSKAERLQLLKEIAGTRTYDDRKKESLKIMKETDAKLKQVETVIGVLDSRLKDLEEESAEFKKYNVLDTTRRALEYSIYEQERKTASDKLDAIEKKRSGGTALSLKQGEEYNVAKAKVTEAEDQIEQLKDVLKKAQAAKKTLTQQQTVLLKRRTEIELNVRDMQDRLTGAKTGKEEAATELKTLHKKMKETNAALEKLNAEYDTVAAAEEAAAVAFQKLDQRLADLASKRERSTKFPSKRERDADIKKQSTRVAKERSDLANQVDKLQKEVADANAAAEKLAAEIEKKEAQMAKNRESGEKLNETLTGLTKKRDDGTNTRKAGWKRESELTSEHADLKTKIDKASRNLQATMDKDTRSGLEAVRAIAKEKNLDGVYGPLIELFECDAPFHPAVELTAGNSLFHVVVDNEVTATTVVKELIARRAGRVTFIPLARINPARPDYPSTKEATPMIEQLRFDPKFEKAMLQVFGKTLIIRDMQAGHALSHDYELNMITIGGDRIDKKGAMSGGFHDFSERGKSRLGAQAEIHAHAERFAAITEELATVKGDLAKLDKTVEAVMNKIETIQNEKAQLRSQNTQLQTDVSTAKREHKTQIDMAARNDKLLPALRASLASLDTQLESLEAEIKSEFRSGLTDDEEAELKRLAGELDASKKALMKARARRAEVDAEKTKLESLLSANLNRREEELNARLNTATQEEESDVLQRDEAELTQLQTQLAEVEKEIKDADKEMDDATKKSGDLANNLDKLRSDAAKAFALLSDEGKAMEKLLAQRTLYLQKKEDAMKRIRDLGALPSEAFEKYADQSQKTLIEKLDKTRAALKKFAGVNKKSVEQYATLTEQKGELAERKTELDNSRASILELMEHLDQKKDEAIERTFKIIAKHFSEVFTELVPEGKATLVIETRKLDEDDEEEEEQKGDRPAKKKRKSRHAEEEAGTIKTSAYTGVAIKVNFHGLSTASHQLSGGQESVVALSLIFAIQRCDPSPFYLLDEIDSALDPVHRTAVANMLKEQSKTTQFICTTFHPELLAAADKLFGVIFKNKASQVRVIEPPEAMKLIQISEREAKELHE